MSQKSLFWLPRLIPLPYLFLLLLFSLDSESVVGFLFHNLPTFFLAAATYLTWRRPRLGGVVLLLFCLLFSLVITHEVLILLCLIPLLCSALIAIREPAKH